MVEGVSALAALGSSDWYLWLFTGLVQGFAQGLTIPMAQAFGANDIRVLKRNVGNAATLTLIIGVLTGVLIAKYLRPRAAVQPELTAEEALEREEERRRLIATQNAFHMLQNYSTERAYGMINDMPVPKQNDGGGT